MPDPVPYVMNFHIHSGNQATGGKLTCDYALPPRLQVNDTLMVQVTWEGAGAPDSLTGYVMIAPAMSAEVETVQAYASPFRTRDNTPICFARLVPQASATPGVFQFQKWTYGRGFTGRYELTFVCEAAATPTTPMRQWSEDPEFDTEG